MPKIPGISGASEPSFRTADRRWLDLDSMVRETTHKLATGGVILSPVAVKAAIQMGRALLAASDDLRGDALGELVSAQLRHRRVLLSPALARQVLVAYAAVFLELEVLEVNEFAT